MTAANDNFRQTELYAALDALTRELNVGLMQGNLWKKYFEANEHFHALGGERGGLVALLRDYQSSPVDKAAEARNAVISQQVVEALGGDRAMAEGYIRAAGVAEQANQLAEFIALGHDSGTVRQRQEAEKQLRGRLVRSLTDEGGVGRTQAEEKVRRYATAVHELAGRFTGPGR